jgi:hypothetical protein
MTRKPKTRNPVAKAVRRIRPKVVPDKRRKLLERVACDRDEQPMTNQKER